MYFTSYSVSPAVMWQCWSANVNTNANTVLPAKTGSKHELQFNAIVNWNKLPELKMHYTKCICGLASCTDTRNDCLLLPLKLFVLYS